VSVGEKGLEEDKFGANTLIELVGNYGKNEMNGSRKGASDRLVGRVKGSVRGNASKHGQWKPGARIKGDLGQQRRQVVDREKSNSRHSFVFVTLGGVHTTKAMKT